VKIEVRLFATLGPYLPEGAQGDGAVMVFPDGTTVGQVVDALHIPPHVPFMTVVNGHEAEPEQVVTEGDVLAMFPPLAGG
jgi:molybdopterin converting factor small subunit